MNLGMGGSWVPRLRRNLNDWEFKELARLLRRLDGVCPILGASDSWVWSLKCKCRFTKSLYNGLINVIPGLLPHKSIWRPYILLKVNFFVNCFFG